MNELLKKAKKVLIVDDEDFIRDLLTDILEDKEMQVISAANGAEALDYVLNHKDEIHCVILDIIMPKMNGIEAFEEIRKLRKNLNILFASAYSDSNKEVSKILQEDKNVDFISKPFLPQDLVQRMIRLFFS